MTSRVAGRSCVHIPGFGWHPTGSALVGTNELRNRKVLGPKGLLQFANAGAGGEPDLLSHGVELEAVAVRAVPAGWAGVADHGEVASALSGAASPSPSPPVSGVMPQASQWMNRPPGASGSSRISARERVPVGGADYDSGGERSSPSQVWRRGMVPPGAKALLVSENSAIANLPWSRVAFPSLDSLRRSPQQVTWSRPITAPSAWFQTGITSGVDRSSTWQRWRAK
jgi:hypothetical protein